MINLLQKKFEVAENLRNYSRRILLLSPKTDFDEINNMIEYRREYEEILNSIDEKIKKLETYENFSEDSIIIKSLKCDIKESIKQTVSIDKEIRKKINDELRTTKEKLNEPERNSKLNIKV